MGTGQDMRRRIIFSCISDNQNFSLTPSPKSAKSYLTGSFASKVRKTSVALQLPSSLLIFSSAVPVSVQYFPNEDQEECKARQGLFSSKRRSLLPLPGRAR